MVRPHSRPAILPWSLPSDRPGQHGPPYSPPEVLYHRRRVGLSSPAFANSMMRTAITSRAELSSCEFERPANVIEGHRHCRNFLGAENVFSFSQKRNDGRHVG